MRGQPARTWRTERDGREGRTSRGARPGEPPGRGRAGRSRSPDGRCPCPATGGAPLGTALDQARLGAALNRLAGTSTERLLARPETTAAEALHGRGLPARTVDGFLRPLLAALLCDPELVTSSRTADLALRDFARGRLCLPEGGAEALPQSLARSLPPGTVHTGVRVTSVSTTSVTTAEHGELRCAAVLVATGARDAAELLPGLGRTGERPWAGTRTGSARATFSSGRPISQSRLGTTRPAEVNAIFRSSAWLPESLRHSPPTMSTASSGVAANSSPA
ncbi:hypothetical protein STENM223S_10340 [Streptomyces tendae]